MKHHESFQLDLKKLRNTYTRQPSVNILEVGKVMPYLSGQEWLKNEINVGKACSSDKCSPKVSWSSF